MDEIQPEVYMLSRDAEESARYAFISVEDPAHILGLLEPDIIQD